MADPQKLTAQLAADLALLESALEFARAGAQAAGLPEACWPHLDLVVEEIFVNIASYAYTGGATGIVEMTCSGCGPGVLSVEMADEGLEYDPLTLRTPNLSASLHDRQVGGLGVFLVRQFTESLEYRREGSWNRLRFVISEASIAASTASTL